jgi:outer membrane protein assembly factor BamD
MTQSNTRSTRPGSIRARSFFPELRTLTTGFTAAALLAASLGMRAQATATPDAAQPGVDTPASAAPATGAQTTGTTPAVNPQGTIDVTNQKSAKTRKQKEDKVVASKDTRQEDKKTKKDNSLVGMDSKLPDKALYDKAEDAVKHGRYDVARLLLQDLLNTYQESQYMMRAKLAIADSWYQEGGTAALTQAEQEYKDFITFFPNAPEAAEAQMRVGDIYFRQMDKPDRDNSNTVKAEQEYRLMLQQFPDSPLVPQAQQRLRDVQETLASREAETADFYITRQNWAAAIARYQTVVDSYPLYSHMDDVLIALGDANEAQARFYRDAKMPGLPAASRERLISLYEHKAAASYTKVVLEHSAAPHVEDARDRLVGMGLPIPTPTPEQAAASLALENSRGQYTLSKRAIALFLHQADTVPAATIGAPSLEDPKTVSAPSVFKQSMADFNTAVNTPAAAPLTPNPAAAAAAAAAPAQNPAAAPAAAAPLEFQSVPAAAAGSGNGSATSESVAAPATTSSGTAVGGIEIIQPTSGSQAPATPPSSPPAFPGTATPAATPAATPTQTSNFTGGIQPVGPPNATPLAPIEKAAPAPDAVNDAAARPQPEAEAPPANGKKPKPAFDKADESSSKHKKKKGLAKLNPF